MDRKARAFMLLAFAFIDFFMFRGAGIHALGLVFLVMGVYFLVTRPKVA